MNKSRNEANFATRAIHVGQEPDPTTGATVPPIHVTSTYTQQSPAKHKGYEYSRSGNPTRAGLEAVLASLEKGTACAAFASGSAATAAILATTAPGEKVLAYADVYGGTFRLMKQVFEAWGQVAVFTDDVSPEAFASLVDDKTKLIWLETPTNPLLRVLEQLLVSIDAGQGLDALSQDDCTPAGAAGDGFRVLEAVEGLNDDDLRPFGFHGLDAL